MLDNSVVLDSLIGNIFVVVDIISLARTRSDPCVDSFLVRSPQGEDPAILSLAGASRGHQGGPNLLDVRQ